MPPAYRDLRYAGGLLPADIQLLLGRFEPERRGASVRVETDSDGASAEPRSVGALYILRVAVICRVFGNKTNEPDVRIAVRVRVVIAERLRRRELAGDVLYK